MSQQEFRLVGKYNGPRIMAARQAAGVLKFGWDFNLPNQLYMRILRSPYPHAKVTAVDASAALAIKGVHGVLTPFDFKDSPVRLAGTTMMILPYDKIRMPGEEVCAVVADDPYIAEEALSKIKVTYEPLPYVQDVEAAMKPDAPQLHEGGNIVRTPTTVTYKVGDSAKALAEADLTAEFRFQSQTIQHNNIGTWAALASWEKDGRLHVWTDTQHMHGARNSLASALNIPQSRICVHAELCGGGFGDGKPGVRPPILAAIFSMKTGRPVKYKLTREENLVLGNHRWTCATYFKFGLKKDGTVTAFEAKNYSNAGPYYSVWGSGMATEQLFIYKWPNFYVECYDIYTNTCRTGPLRCVADPQSCWMIETAMDRLAFQLNMNPIEFRLKNNMFTQGDKDPTTGNRIPSIGQPQCINRARELAEWDKKWKPWPKTKPTSGVVRGIGVANHCCGHGAGSLANAAVLVMNADGSLTIYTGATDIGNARREQLAIIAAEHLGLPFEKVTVANYSTDTGPDSGATVGSRQTKSAGNAVGVAALQVKDQLLQRAADRLKVAKEDLKLGEEKIYVAADPSKSVTIQELVASPPWIIAGGQWIPPANTTQRTYATHIAEVEVDCDTGLVKVLRVVAVHDIGRVIYRKSCISQVHGGIIQGIGMALQEELLFDPQTGRCYNASMLDHKMPLSLQTPEIIVDFVENPEQPPDSYNHGAKGLGEPPTSPIVPAITNAIANAIGVYFDRLPVTPDKILKSLGKV
ncbi:MAG: molybdopterin-dependent oxidoreductase [Thaumarchaeota archaeon]|nr:molybdopterin-dependent oxidoreductase [Nitrososphaerota archaeon]